MGYVGAKSLTLTRHWTSRAADAPQPPPGRQLRRCPGQVAAVGGGAHIVGVPAGQRRPHAAAELGADRQHVLTGRRQPRPVLRDHHPAASSTRRPRCVTSSVCSSASVSWPRLASARRSLWSSFRTSPEPPSDPNPRVVRGVDLRCCFWSFGCCLLCAGRADARITPGSRVQFRGRGRGGRWSGRRGEGAQAGENLGEQAVAGWQPQGHCSEQPPWPRSKLTGAASSRVSRPGLDLWQLITGA
jgi:hypothetical protein